MTIKTTLKLAGAAALILGIAPFALAHPPATSTQPMHAMKSGQAGMMQAHHQLSKSQIKQVQQALDQHGYKVTADGKWGEQSRKATEQFQKKNQLKVTGQPDKKTRQALGLPW